MHARNVKPALFKNELLGQEDPILTLLFVGLWCLADEQGILEDRPLRIKAELFPYRESLDVNRYLTDLERLEFINRYQVGPGKFILVVNFRKHQNPHHTEKKSTFPKPREGGNGGLTDSHPLLHGGYPADSLIPDSLRGPSQGSAALGPVPPPAAPGLGSSAAGPAEVSPIGDLDDWEAAQPMPTLSLARAAFESDREGPLPAWILAPKPKEAS